MAHSLLILTLRVTSTSGEESVRAIERIDEEMGYSIGRWATSDRQHEQVSGI